MYKEDLDLHNHLVGLKQLFLKLTFLTSSDLQKVRRELNTAVRKNKERAKAATGYSEMLQQQQSAWGNTTKTNPMDHLVDMREHDMPLHVRVSIDKSIFVGSWYDVVCKGSNEQPTITKREGLIERPDCIVLAFDIETTKLPLKFPFLLLNYRLALVDSSEALAPLLRLQDLR